MSEGHRSSRRKFLIRELPLLTGSVVLFAGCTTRAQSTFTPLDRIIRTPTPKKETPQPLPEITTKEIHQAITQAVKDFNSALDTTFSENQILSDILIISNLKEYQDIIAEAEEGYTPTNELNRPAITTRTSHSKGRKIVLFTPAIANLASQVPNTEQGKNSRSQFIENIILHELVHYSAKEYKSDEIHNLFFGKMVANIPPFKDKKAQQGIVVGAKTTAVVEGVRKSGFQALEEAEAVIISDFAISKRNKPQLISSIGGNELGIPRQVTLTKDLLSKLGMSYDLNIKLLQKLREKEKGREEFCKIMGERFNVPASDHLFFGLSVLFAIDTGQEGLYRELVDKQRPTPSSK